MLSLGQVAAELADFEQVVNQVNFSALTSDGVYTRFIIHYKESDSRKRINTQASVLAHLDNVHTVTGYNLAMIRELATGGYLIEVNEKLDKTDAEGLMVEFARNPDLSYIEPDARMTISLVPNDTTYNQQWHYFEATGGLNLPDAWDVVSGSGVTVAVVDTGIVNHTDLNVNIIGGYDFISDATAARDGNGRDSNPADEGDWFLAGECGSGSPSNSSWHGTHVAGTVAAVTNNNKGVAGVAFDAKVVPVRVLGKCGGSLSDIADAIVWASGGSVSGVPNNTNPAEVINMSLGGGGACGSTYQNAINIAVNNGTAVVVAAGNSNADVSGFRPANCSNVITVAALDRQGNRAFYSNFGSLIDITAPGGETATASNGVRSTLNSGTTSSLNESYAFYQGTSMAAPHIAGLVALMLEANPDLTPSQIETELITNARPIPGSCTGGCGAGVADATATINALAGGGGEIPVATQVVLIAVYGLIL
ncbi:MAG: S8 family peptidase [Wenzhouxiangellaceae bacterium]